jgi:hypothetical protein
MSPGELGWWGVLIAVVGGAIRVSTPYLFVSLGETLTEKSGRVNLGLEGTLLMGAMSGYGASYLTGSAWLGVLVAAGGRRLRTAARRSAICRASMTWRWASVFSSSAPASRFFWGSRLSSLRHRGFLPSGWAK